jgi:4-aminobutyrate aminotransferase-like enzyme
LPRFCRASTPGTCRPSWDFRHSSPLIITDEQIDEMFDILESAVTGVQDAML